MIKPMLPLLLPLAVKWANKHHHTIQQQGESLTTREIQLAQQVGVVNTEKVRVLTVSKIPTPTHPVLLKAANKVGFMTTSPAGLTLGHSIYICEGFRSERLLSHELRHVQQYEHYGSIKHFLREYLAQVLQYGYINAPLEIDARQHEVFQHPTDGYSISDK